MPTIDISNLSRQLQVEVLIPDGRSPQNVSQPGQPPNALINWRPYFMFNTVHYSLFQRIGRLTELGFNVTVLLYDMTVLHGGLSSEIANDEDVIRSMDHVFMSLRRYGIEMEKVEVLSESVLWRSEGFMEGFPKDIMRLFYLCADDVFISNKIKNNVKLPSHIFDVLLGMLYEKILQPDFVFYAGEEAAIWKQARNRRTLITVFNDNHMPPVILRLESLCNIDGLGLHTLKQRDPFSDRLSLAEAIDVMHHADQSYLQNINNLNNIYRPVNGLPVDILYNFRNHVYGDSR